MSDVIPKKPRKKPRQSRRDRAFDDLARSSYAKVQTLESELPFDVQMRRENLHAWRRNVGATWNTSEWVWQARRAIDKVLADNLPVDDLPSLWDNGAALMKRLGRAYPFGERAAWPYKIWLAELRVVKRLVAPPSTVALEDYHILQVARDAELQATPRGIAQAKALMLEVSSDVHANPCVICGSKANEPCKNMDSMAVRPISEQAASSLQLGLFGHIPDAAGQGSYYQIVPHEGRIRTRLAQVG